MSKPYSNCPQCRKMGVHACNGYVGPRTAKAIRKFPALTMWSCRYCNFVQLSDERPKKHNDPVRRAVEDAVAEAWVLSSELLDESGLTKDRRRATFSSSVRGNIGQGVECYPQNIKVEGVSALDEYGDWTAIKGVFNIECMHVSAKQLDKILRILQEGDEDEA